MRDLLLAVLLGEAEPSSAAKVRAHLALCRACREESGRFASILEGLAAEEIADPGAAYWESFLPRLRNRIAAEGLAARRPAPVSLWAAAASLAILLLGAAASMTLSPPAGAGPRMALRSLAARVDPETLSRTLDEVAPGTETVPPASGFREAKVPRPGEMERALDSLIPMEDDDLVGAARELSPEARRWLVRTLSPDRV